MKSTWALSTAPGHGEADVTSDGHYTYTPAQDWNGQGADAFEFTASDGTLTGAPATITVANRQNGTVEVAKGVVAFGKVPGDDRARLQGTPAEAGSCASDVTVALNGTVFTQTISASTFQVKAKGRRCVYQRPKGGDGGIQRSTST